MSSPSPVARPLDEALEDVVAWLAVEGTSLVDPVRADLLTGGRSHLTYRLTDGGGRRVVLRVPPAGPAGAHDVEREHRILGALAATPVPVPRPLALCTDPTILGGPFSVVEHLEGYVLTTADDGATLPWQARSRAGTAIVDALADVHALDPAALGLDPDGRGADYLQRQLARWTRRAEAATGAGAESLRTTSRELGASPPAQRSTSLVHGDYKFANVMVAGNGHLVAVLDWELSAAGDPLCDLGGLLAMWPHPGEPRLFESPTRIDGFGTRADVIAAYAMRTGTDVSDMSWYHAFALWRIACLLAGVTERYRSGVMADDGFDITDSEVLVGRLADAARELL